MVNPQICQEDGSKAVSWEGIAGAARRGQVRWRDRWAVAPFSRSSGLDFPDGVALCAGVSAPQSLL